MKTNVHAYYSVGFGLQGCYLDDSNMGAYEIQSRKELCDMIRGAIEFYDLPKSCFSQLYILKIWKHIKNHGSSCLHLHIHHKQYALSFYGLTAEEFTEAQNNEY